MYVTFCGLQGHHRSKVIVPNESPYAISYLSIIVTAGLSGTLLKIFTLEMLNFSKIQVL